jgi:hypothetical protein
MKMKYEIRTTAVNDPEAVGCGIVTEAYFGGATLPYTKEWKYVPSGILSDEKNFITEYRNIDEE